MMPFLAHFSSAILVDFLTFIYSFGRKLHFYRNFGFGRSSVSAMHQNFGFRPKVKIRFRSLTKAGEIGRYREREEREREREREIGACEKNRLRETEKEIESFPLKGAES
jgi:hypothetical protein